MLRPLSNLFVSALAANLAWAQPMRHLTLVNDGVSGAITIADGREQTFHVAVTGTGAHLYAAHRVRDEAPLPYGSKQEVALLEMVESWCANNIDENEAKRLRTLEKLPQETAANQQFLRRAILLRTIHAYRRVTRPQIDKVLPGRGTVSLGLRIQLADDRPMHVMWRKLDGVEHARMHVGMDTDAVPFDSRLEKHLIVAIQIWLQTKLGPDTELWEVPIESVDEDVRPLLDAWRGYLRATSPRLRSAAIVMNGNPAGSHLYTVTDERNRPTAYRFDYRANTQTPGRIKLGRKLVELGSKAEAAALATLDRTVALRRQFLGDKAKSDPKLNRLIKDLADYRIAFVKRKR